MKLMPEQPTEEMLKAGHDAGGYEDDGEWGWASPDRTYKAMYVVAPNIEHEEIAYVATTEGIKKHVTNYQYEKFSDTVKALYEPYQSQEVAKLKLEKEMLVEALVKLSDMGGECLDSTQMREFAKEVLAKAKGE